MDLLHIDSLTTQVWNKWYQTCTILFIQALHRFGLCLPKRMRFIGNDSFYCMGIYAFCDWGSIIAVLIIYIQLFKMNTCCLQIHNDKQSLSFILVLINQKPTQPIAIFIVAFFKRHLFTLQSGMHLADISIYSMPYRRIQNLSFWVLFICDVFVCDATLLWYECNIPNRVILYINFNARRTNHRISWKSTFSTIDGDCITVEKTAVGSYEHMGIAYIATDICFRYLWQNRHETVEHPNDICIITGPISRFNSINDLTMCVWRINHPR